MINKYCSFLKPNFKQYSLSIKFFKFVPTFKIVFLIRCCLLTYLFNKILTPLLKNIYKQIFGLSLYNPFFIYNSNLQVIFKQLNY